MELNEEILLADAKLDIKKEIDPKNESTDAFSLLMHSFALNKDYRHEYEKEEFHP